MDTWEKTDNKFGLVRRAPVGTVAAVISYNFPLNFAARKIATAIAAGCPCILIPSQKSMLTASMLGEIIAEVQMPEGSVSIFPCDTFELEEILTDPRIKIFSYTGDVDTGWNLRSKAKNKKAILETGGMAIAVVDEKSDLEFAAKKCVRGAFSDSGQMYLSLQHILVHAEIYSQFVSEMIKQVQNIHVGDPDHEKTDIGPLIDEETADETMALIDEAITKGAKLLAGGKRDGNLVYPTVLVKTTPEMKISNRICFGPVVSISTFSKMGEAIHLINNIPFAVQVGIFSKEVDRIFTLFNSFEIGSMIVNDIPTFRADHVPYGGFKRFGLGKEGVRYNIDALMENKILVLNFDQVKDWKGFIDE
jgi:glyceraldehyde-3-phosphate dehydrogenase (NADP+)